MKILNLILTKYSSSNTTTTKIYNSITLRYKHNTCPAEAIGVIQHRVHPEDTIEDVIEYNRKIIDDTRVNIEIISKLNPSPVSSSTHPAFLDMRNCVHAQVRRF